MKYVDEALVRLDNQGPKTVSIEELSVLEKLLKIDRSTAIVMALDFLLAGVDTTSGSAVTFLYFMAKNPEKQEKLRREILEKLPNKDSWLDADAMKNLPYLRACMKESSRIMPVVFSNMRSTGQDLVLKGYRIPKGVTQSLVH